MAGPVKRGERKGQQQRLVDALWIWLGSHTPIPGKPALRCISLYLSRALETSIGLAATKVLRITTELGRQLLGEPLHAITIRVGHGCKTSSHKTFSS